MAIKDGAAWQAGIRAVRSCAWGQSWPRQRDRDVETVVRDAGAAGGSARSLKSRHALSSANVATISSTAAATGRMVSIFRIGMVM